MSIVPECIMVLGVVAEEAGVVEAQDEYQDHAQHQDHDQAAQVQRSPKPITAQRWLHQWQLTCGGSRARPGRACTWTTCTPPRPPRPPPPPHRAPRNLRHKRGGAWHTVIWLYSPWITLHHILFSTNDWGSVSRGLTFFWKYLQKIECNDGNLILRQLKNMNCCNASSPKKS